MLDYHCNTFVCPNLLHEMVHKGLQRHVVSEDGLRRLSTDTAVRSGGVCSGGVQLREQETSLRSASVTDNEARQRETVRDEILDRSLAHYIMSWDTEDVPWHLPLAAPRVWQSSRNPPDLGILLSSTRQQFRRGK